MIIVSYQSLRRLMGRPSITKPRGSEVLHERPSKAGDKTASRSIVPFRSINERRDQPR
jgi:hypothetical protein